MNVEYRSFGVFILHTMPESVNNEGHDPVVPH